MASLGAASLKLGASGAQHPDHDHGCEFGGFGRVQAGSFCKTAVSGFTVGYRVQSFVQVIASGGRPRQPTDLGVTTGGPLAIYQSLTNRAQNVPRSLLH